MRIGLIGCELDLANTSFRSPTPRSAISNPHSMWYRRRDSNPHYLVSKTSASSRLGYAGKSKDEG